MKTSRSVYVINSAGTDNYKIGRSHNVRNRVGEIQTSNANTIIIIDFFECDDCNTLEKQLHNTFKKNKIKGEWFKFSNIDLGVCKLKGHELAKKINKSIIDGDNSYKQINIETYEPESSDTKFSNVIIKSIGEINNDKIINRSIKPITETNNDKIINRSIKPITEMNNDKIISRCINSNGIVEYKCNICMKIYNKKSNYMRHVSRQKSCINVESNSEENNINIKNIPSKRISEENNINIKNIPSKRISEEKCQYCHSMFTRKDTLQRHINNRCKIKKNIMMEATEIEQLKKTIKELELEVQNYKMREKLFKQEIKILKSGVITVKGKTNKQNQAETTSNKL
jgi:hypothetical protein